ncbi:MAG TPA: TusE/DsrC/DsvC family sulfur relay protein [bacterium]|nr:TusE/DsrC/DsvC family sulfur relay protein [bacterium]
MSVIEIAGRQVDIDEDGFIQDPNVWDRDLAEGIAKTESIDAMTDDHWKIVNYIRGYYLEFGTAPMIRMLCKKTDMNLKRIYELFPSGPAKGACKIAGLPKPTGCV